MSYYNVLFLFPLTQALLKDEATTHTERCSYTLTSGHLAIPMHCVLAVVECTKLVKILQLVSSSLEEENPFNSSSPFNVTCKAEYYCMHVGQQAPLHSICTQLCCGFWCIFWA